MLSENEWKLITMHNGHNNCYSLRPLVPIAGVDVFRHILVFGYIHTRDK
jgi:hypothetical protein